MEHRQTLFAFRLAANERTTTQDEPASQTRWKAEDGIAGAGCTDYRFPGNVRAYSQVFGVDRGIYC